MERCSDFQLQECYVPDCSRPLVMGITSPGNGRYLSHRLHGLQQTATDCSMDSSIPATDYYGLHGPATDCCRLNSESQRVMVFISY